MTKDIIDINEASIKIYIESIRSDDQMVRAALDFGYSYDGQTFLLYEIRPIWNDPSKIQHLEYAKIRFIKSKKIWKLYWKRANGKWELYTPFPQSPYISEVIEIIEKDKKGCFYG